MVTLLLRQAAVALCAGGVVLVLWSPDWSMGRKRRGAFCPGARSAWWRRLLPMVWVLARGCGYDLAGLPRDGDGAMVCPECGRRLRDTSEALRRPRRFRAARLGLVMLMAAGVFRAAPYVRSGKWAARMPTGALIIIKGQMGTWTPWSVRRQLGARARDRTMSDKQIARYVPTLIHDLRADGVPGNGAVAMEMLREFRLAGPLEAALESRDRQERQLAADVLRDLVWEDGHPVSDALLHVTIEGLRSDDLPRDEGSMTGVFDARFGFNFLCQFPDRVGPLVAAGMGSDDPQQRVLCAALAGFTGQSDLLDRAAPILLEALLDNEQEGDAMVATEGLYRFGAPAVPFLVPFVDDADEQRRTLVRMILDGLGTPLRFNPEMVAMGVRPKMVRGVRNPAAEWQRVEVRRWDRWYP